MNLSVLVREEYTNASKHCRFGDSGEPSEVWTDDIGRLFRDLRSEYGKASKFYVDGKGGKVQHVGWTFQKRMRYEDARQNRPEDYYIREVWVTLYESCDLDDPAHVVTRRNGAVTHHPF